MPDATKNIYIDWSYFATQSGGRNVIQEYVAGNPDSIGEVNIITSYITGISGGNNTGFDIETEYEVTITGAGFSSIAAALSFNNTTSGVIDSFIEYTTPFTVSGSVLQMDIGFSYFRQDTKVSGTQYVPIQFISGETYGTFNSVPLAYKCFDDIITIYDIDCFYTAANYYDPGDPESHPVLSDTLPVRSYYTLGSTISGAINVFNDVTFAGYVFKFKPYDLSYYFNVIVGIEGNSAAYNFNAETISGSLVAVDFNSICGIFDVQNILFNSICGLDTEVFLYFTTDVIDGRVGYNYFNQICGLEEEGVGYNFNVGLFSLKIGDLSVGVGDFILADGTVCVDITDDIYGVNQFETYFVIDGVVASGIFTPISNGYRMCYDPIDNFASLVGAAELKVHAKNNNNNILEKVFYLTSGYIVEYDNSIYKDKFNLNDIITVKLTAENFSSCPALGGSAYWFEVFEGHLRDLSASIVGILRTHSNLSATLVPDTDLVFFYGKTFMVELRVKDYAGNEMPPYIFEFKIEDKPV